MELRPQLVNQAKQSITITPRVIQSIKLLKFGHEELCAYLKEQEERNPLLEVVLPEIGAERQPSPQAKQTKDTASAPVERSHGKSDRASGPVSGIRGSVAAGDLRSIEETFACSRTLREVLLQQVDLNIHDGAERAVAVEIVESIDPDGYLRRDLDEIADCLEIEEAFVENVLRHVQTFEPSGVGARSVAECLRLQLEDRREYTPQMALLLENLDLLARYDLMALARKCGVNQNEIAVLAGKIRQLDPRPGKQFDNEPILPALPDVNVLVREDGSWNVELNSALLPKVLVDREYYAEMRSVTCGEDDLKFVNDCMKDANWLVRNVDQRAKTLLKVATEIVKRQQEFFRLGVKHIRPLCQGDIADVLGVHRSTVCRAISGKYMMTNRGLFELKYFFSNPISAGEGEEDFSAESIRARIRNLVEQEPDNKALSDDAIMANLRDDGVAIARRTVAKYREMLSIPSSAVRMRQRKAANLEARALSA